MLTEREDRAQPRLSVTQITERLELGSIVLLLLIIGGVWAFVELAGVVLDGEARWIERRLLLALRSPDDPDEPFGPPWLQEMGRDLTALGGVAVLTIVTLASAAFLVMRRLWRAAGLLLLAIGSGLLISTLLKGMFERPRPDLVEHGSIVHDASFPSGHSLMSALVYLTVGAVVARVQPSRRVKAFALGLAVLIALLVGVSRVYLGVHWPTDVLAGWAVGTAWALLFWLVARWLQRRGQVETDREV